MKVDLIGNACITGHIRAWQIINHDGATIGPDNPLPDNEGPILSKSDTAVIPADQPRTLRNKKMLAGDSVKNLLCDLGNDSTR